MIQIKTLICLHYINNINGIAGCEKYLIKTFWDPNHQNLKLGSLQETSHVHWRAAWNQLPWWFSVKKPPANARDWLHPWEGRIPWRMAWQPTPVLLSGEPHGRKSLAGCSPWGHRVRHNLLRRQQISSLERKTNRSRGISYLWNVPVNYSGLPLIFLLRKIYDLAWVFFFF